jgi:hypothetical protein
MDYLQPTPHLLLLSCFKVRAKLLFKETTALGAHLLMTVGVFESSAVIKLHGSAKQ